jgi:hypothetical protein
MTHNTYIIDPANSSAQQVIRANAKVFVRGKYLFGCTSSYRIIQLLRYALPLPTYLTLFRPISTRRLSNVTGSPSRFPI